MIVMFSSQLRMQENDSNPSNLSRRHDDPNTPSFGEGDRVYGV
jgi:hypothetical protein